MRFTVPVRFRQTKWLNPTSREGRIERLREARRIARRVVLRRHPGRAHAAIDPADLVHRVGTARLVQVRRAAGLGQVPTPVPGGVQRPVLLLHRRAGDAAGRRACQRASVHRGQSIERVVSIELVQRAAHRILLPGPVAVPVVALIPGTFPYSPKSALRPV